MSSSMGRLRRLQGLGRKSTKSKADDTSRADDASAEEERSGDSREKSPSAQNRGTRPQRDQQIGPQRGDRAIIIPQNLTTTQTLSEAVPGVELQNVGGRCYAVASAIPLTDRRGGIQLADLLHHSPDLLTLFHTNFNLTDDAQFRSAAFLDTETTGLGAGAGVYCFMVGIGRFESYPQETPLTPLTQEALWREFNDDAQGSAAHDANQPPTHFVVRQLFMRRPSEEVALLTVVAALLADCSMTVSFNGRVFDLPLLRTRFQQNQHFLPEESRTVPLLDPARPHLDLLIPARRLWRRRLDSCRLVWLEKHILEFERGADDVPGHMIPMLYAQFVASLRDDPKGQAGYMPSIFYHNQEDITSMVALTSRIYALFGVLHQDELAQQETTHHPHVVDGLDWLSLGCCFEAIEAIDKAERAFAQALEMLGTDSRAQSGRTEGYRRLGLLYKRRGSWTEATAIWQQWLTTVSDDDPTPYVELAKYCEWQTNDLEQAEMWTRWALHNVESSPRMAGKSIQFLAELNHRLARISRKRVGK